MKFKSFVLSFILVNAFQAEVIAQRLEFRIPQWSDTTIYLARYYGPKLYYADTARLENGVVVFDGSKHPEGLYGVVLPDTKYFELINSGEDVIMTLTDTSSHVYSVTVQQSENNKIFYQYVAAIKKRDQTVKPLTEKYNAAEGDIKKQEAISKKIQTENKKLNAVRAELISAHSSLFAAQLLRLTMDVELPEPPRDKNGVVTDSNYVYNYYIRHYWDGIDLKNPALIYTPVYHNRLDNYFSEKGLIQTPDTIIKYAAILLDEMIQADPKNEVFKYSLNHIITKYQGMQIMGMDEVFWYLGKNYFCAPNNKAYWMPEENLKRLCERVQKTENVLLGRQAIPLILTDTTETKWINFYDIQAEYTVLYFWEPDCGHCKVHTPELQTLYEKKFKARNIEVYAVAKATGDDFELWKKFIREKNLTFTNVGLTKNIYDQAMKDPRPLLQYTTLESLNYGSTYDVYSTPKIFILDKDKKILFKQIGIAQLEALLDMLTGHADDEKLFPLSKMVD